MFYIALAKKSILTPCECEQGNKRPDTSSTCRSGCKSMIRLLRTPDHGWYISRFVEQHTHPLSEIYAENKQWNSHSQIDPITKEFILKLRNNNISIGRVCSILGVSEICPICLSHSVFPLQQYGKYSCLCFHHIVCAFQAIKLWF